MQTFSLSIPPSLVENEVNVSKVFLFQFFCYFSVITMTNFRQELAFKNPVVSLGTIKDNLMVIFCVLVFADK